MAHAFDNRNIVSNKQQTFYSIDSPSLSRRDIKFDLWERSSSPKLSSRSNHPPPSYEETVNANDSSYRQRQQLVTGINHTYLPGFNFNRE
jgi:hypothetical protein